MRSRRRRGDSESDPERMIYQSTCILVQVVSEEEPRHGRLLIAAVDELPVNGVSSKVRAMTSLTTSQAVDERARARVQLLCCAPLCPDSQISKFSRLRMFCIPSIILQDELRSPLRNSPNAYPLHGQPGSLRDDAGPTSSSC